MAQSKNSQPKKGKGQPAKKTGKKKDAGSASPLGRR